jgi:hypothetical protein
MSRFARVTSIEVLDTLAVALQRFRSDAKGAMDDLQMQLQRAREWIRYDRKEYWAHELKRSEAAESEARVQLQQARSAKRIDDREPACIDEKRALERAKRRHETARQKVEAVRRWTREVERAVDDAQSASIRFRGWVDADLVQAVAALGRMGASLETYTSLEVPAGSVAVGQGEETPPQEGGDEAGKDSPRSGAPATGDAPPEAGQDAGGGTAT